MTYLVYANLNKSREIFRIFVTVGIAMIMLFPAIQYIENYQAPSSTVYRYGNEFVQFTGQNAILGFQTGNYPVAWNVYRFTPKSAINQPFVSSSNSSCQSGLTQETFSSISNSRIWNSQQNSAVMIESNNNMKMTEIFSYMNNSIDSSAALEYTNNGTASFAIGFTIAMNRTSSAQIGGINPQTIYSPQGMSPRSFLINRNDWQIDTSSLSISWQNDQTVFRGGILTIGYTSDSLTLIFGPVEMHHNETYSIDPIVHSTPFRPIRRIPPGGGGGGVCSSPSVSNSVTSNISQNGIYYGVEGLPITLNADVTSLGGAGSATLMFDINAGGYYHYVQSEQIYSTGQKSFIWYPPWYESVGYFNYEAYVRNPQYTSHGNPVTLGIFQSSPSAQNSSVYDSSGALVGQYSLSAVISGTTVVKVRSVPDPRSSYYIEFGTIAGWSSPSLGVWSIDQKIENSASPGCNGGDTPLTYGHIMVSKQTNTDQTFMGALDSYLIGIANSFTHNVIPSPSLLNSIFFNQPPSITDWYIPNPYSYTQEGSAVAPVCAQEGSYTYYPIEATNGSASHIFGIQTYNDKFGANSLTVWMDIFEYSVTLSILSDSLGSTYSSSTSLLTGVYVAPV
ncbi:MAG: hypothetical protein ACYCSO_00935 [Cuniculiplasma sp.]